MSRFIISWRKLNSLKINCFLQLQGLTGVGFAMCASCLVLCLTNLAVITWSCQAIYTLFNDQVIMT